MTGNARLAEIPGVPPPAPAPAALVVDDSAAQRRVLAIQLGRLGFRVREAASGEAALAACREGTFDVIVSDWMMPGMNGIAFCRAFRALARAEYTYFILLTSKSEKEDVAQGLDVGADDFLSKPVNAAEFRARIAAGQRIVAMQRELSEKNRTISAAFEEIRTLYDALDRDLVEARRLQQALVGERLRRVDGGEAALLLRPCGHVGGDLVGSYRIDADRLGLFAIDVSGHGIASALVTARLAANFAGEETIALERLPGGGVRPRGVTEIVSRLNRILLTEFETDHYVTMLLAHVDLRDGAVSLVQAGHPHPVVLRRDGRIERLGAGGLPVGLFPDATHAEVRTRLAPGDRLLLHSDGMTELHDPSGVELGEAGLDAILTRNADLGGPALFEAVMWDLTERLGEEEFEDDLSAVLFAYEGRGPRAG